MGNVGIDISHYQASVPAGDWLFVVHAVGDGLNFTDPVFAQRFSTQQGLRGAYLYARPGESSGVDQANHFADLCLAAGFKPGVDLWQLDCEGGENTGIAPVTWQTFITDFMWQAFKRLGRRGFLYAGWPFVQENGLQQLVNTFQWWLPDYGFNDGVPHSPQVPAAFQPLVVIQQFTSFGGLDQNLIRSQARWNNVMQTPPNPAVQALKALVAYLNVLRLKPLRFGDAGAAVQRLNALLAKRGFPVNPASKVYDTNTQVAVGAWKWNHHFSNLDDKVCGYPCFVSLLKG